MYRQIVRMLSWIIQKAIGHLEIYNYIRLRCGRLQIVSCLLIDVIYYLVALVLDLSSNLHLGQIGSQLKVG